IDGFTPEQRFFLGFAQIWRSVQRDEDLKLRLNTDPHSPARYRVNGPLSDSVEFQKAFNLPDNCPMVRQADKKVNIWYAIPNCRATIPGCHFVQDGRRRACPTVDGQQRTTCPPLNSEK